MKENVTICTTGKVLKKLFLKNQDLDLNKQPNSDHFRVLMLQESIKKESTNDDLI